MTNQPFKYKAILFDLDGVLVEMPDGHYEALNNALSLFGAKIQKEEHNSFFNGLPTKRKLEELEKQGRLPAGLRNFVNLVKQKHTKEMIPKYCAPDYSKIIMMKHLKNQGYKLGCCSNSIRETLDLMLKSAGLYDFFDVILGNTDVVNAKPHPEIYLKACEQLGIKPEETIIVEDAPHGIEAAKKAGGRVFEVRGCRDVNLSLFENLIKEA